MCRVVAIINSKHATITRLVMQSAMRPQNTEKSGGRSVFRTE